MSDTRGASAGDASAGPTPEAVLEADVAVVGAGIAGASLAFELARMGVRCVLLERESQPGYHTTGRSAAVYAPLYGNRPVRALTRASRPFYDAPPAGFADRALLTPRAGLFYASRAQQQALERFGDEMAAEGRVRMLRNSAELQAQVPVLREQAATMGLLDASCSDIDVHALLQGYLRGARRAGTVLLTGFDAGAHVTRSHDGFELSRPRRAGAPDATRVRAPVVAVCAGAWADPLAAAFGAAAPGIEPRRRTAIVFEPVAGPLPADAPLAISIVEDVYFRPEAGRVLASPADETPSPPCDAQPEELDVAVLIDRLQRDTTMVVRRITGRWAGLRSFAADRSPVVGFDPVVNGLYWMVGQGGYGIQMAPALAQFAASQLAGRAPPGHVRDEGFDAALVAPGRVMTHG